MQSQTKTEDLAHKASQSDDTDDDAGNEPSSSDA